MNKKQRIALLVVGAGLLIAAAIVFWPRQKEEAKLGDEVLSNSQAISQPEAYPDPDKPQKTEDGRPLVPDFALWDRDGAEVKLSDFAGKGIVINFWASWCGWCDKEMEGFEQLAADYSESEDLVILMINVTDGRQETMEGATAYFDGKGFTHLRPYFDPDLYATAVFGASSLPMTFTIDKDGYLKAMHTGYAEYEDLAAMAAEVA